MSCIDCIKKTDTNGNVIYCCIDYEHNCIYKAQQQDNNGRIIDICIKQDKGGSIINESYK